MPNTQITITWNNGNPRFNPDPGVTRLKFGETVLLRLTGAPADGSIDEVTIYANRQQGNQNQKNPSQQLCVGKRQGGGKPCSIYSIAFGDANHATITDLEQPTQAQRYWFGVSGSPGDWELDPELINEPEVDPAG